MSKWFLLVALLSLTPMLFMSMNVEVYPTAKLFCKVAAGVFTVLAIISYLRSPRRSS